jgi:hypothetical protein
VISDIQTGNISCLPPVRSAVSSLVNSLEHEVEKALRCPSVTASPEWPNRYLIITGWGRWIAGVDDGTCLCYREGMDMFHESNSILRNLTEKLW